MKVCLENTDSLVTLRADGKDVPARMWEGQTESGIPIVAFITLIFPQTHDVAANEQFATELREGKRATFEPFAHGAVNAG